jgi:hypothetical protein
LGAFFVFGAGISSSSCDLEETWTEIFSFSCSWHVEEPWT